MKSLSYKIITMMPKMIFDDLGKSVTLKIFFTYINQLNKILSKKTLICNVKQIYLYFLCFPRCPERFCRPPLLSVRQGTIANFPKFHQQFPFTNTPSPPPPPTVNKEFFIKSKSAPPLHFINTPPSPQN